MPKTKASSKRLLCMVSLPPRTILYGFSAGSDTTKVKKIILARYIDSRIFFRVATGYAKEGDTAREDDGNTVREDNGNTAREANEDITRENDGDAARENDGSSSSVHGCPNEAKHDVSTRAAHGATITYILTFTHSTTIDTTKLSDKLVDYITTSYMIKVKKYASTHAHIIMKNKNKFFERFLKTYLFFSKNYPYLCHADGFQWQVEREKSFAPNKRSENPGRREREIPGNLLRRNRRRREIHSYVLQTRTR